MSAKLNRWFLLVFALLLVAGIVVTSAAIAEGIKQKHQILCVNPFMQNVKGVSLNLNDAISAKDNKTFRQAMSGAMTYFNSMIEVTPQSVYWAYPEDLQQLESAIVNAHTSYSALYNKRSSQSELFKSEKALLARYAAAFDELLHALVLDDEQKDPKDLDPKVFDPDALSEMIQAFSGHLQTNAN